MVVAKMSTDREQLSVRADRGLDLPILHPLMVGGREAFVPILDPLDRAFQQQRRRRHCELLRVERVLRPKAAANLGRDYPHLVLRESERLNQNALGLVRHLGGIPERQQLLDGIEASHHSPRLDRMAAAFVDTKTF